MKTWNIFLPVALLVVGFGCRSNEPHVASRTTTTQINQTVDSEPSAPPAVAEQELGTTTIEELTTNNVTYTIQSIPNKRLTPTSREGDQANEIYSSNIIAVRVHTNNPSAVNSTNGATIPPQQDK